MGEGIAGNLRVPLHARPGDTEHGSADAGLAAANKAWADAVADAEKNFKANVASLEAALQQQTDARIKQAEIAGAQLTGQLQEADAQALTGYWTDQTDAANDHFSGETTANVNWTSADYGAQTTALTGLNSATQIPWTQYLQDKAEHVAAWWAADGADLYTDWAADVNAEYSAYDSTVGTAYQAMVTAVVSARNVYHGGTPSGGDSAGNIGVPPKALLPPIQNPITGASTIQQKAAASSTYLKTKSAADEQLAIDTDAAAGNQRLLDAAQADYNAALAAANLVYQQAVAGADGAKALADAQATDDYVDEVYGEGGDYQAWQDSLGATENAYELAESGARETLNRNLAAHDAVLRAGLADTFADAMEQLATDHPSPWASRVAADARAESDKVSAEQTALQTYEQAVVTAQADFKDAVSDAEHVRSQAQTDAVCTVMTTVSDAAVEKATDQATANQTAADNGAGGQKRPEQGEPGDGPEDVVVGAIGRDEDGNLGTMPVLSPADLLAGENSFCTTLDLGICFAAGTPVLMADGTTKPIEDVKPGDLVMAVPEDDAEGAVGARMVEQGGSWGSWGSTLDT